MTSQQNDTTANEHEQLEQHEVNEVLRFLREYGRPFGLAAALALLVYFGLTVVRHNRARNAADAAQLLYDASTPEQLEVIIDQYGKTPSAPTAVLLLAARYFHTGQYEEARAQYERFAAGWPDHRLRPAADLNAVECMEGAGRIDEALKGYETFLAAETNYFLRPAAILGKGRCLEASGRTEEARAVYEDFLTAEPESAWAGRAEAYLARLKQASAPVAPPSAPTSAPPAAGPATEG